VDQNDGKILESVANDNGTKKVYEAWQSTKNTGGRTKYFQTFLERQITKLQSKLTQNIHPWPLLISGMASSSIGMKELPYGTLPFRIDQPQLPVERFKPTEEFPYKTYLISGLQSKSEVMRGEETQLLGLFSSTNIANGLYLLAGTHSKHIIIQEKSVVNFNTYMTGELFGLLSSQSILSNSVKKHDNDTPGPFFKKGINNSLDANLFNKLFRIRANNLINQSDPLENYDVLSGLLIGTELQAIPEQHEAIVLAGDRQLQNYYAAALEILGYDYIRQERSSQEITSLGQRTIFNQLTTIL
jgi:2-dehydro-3-deoxygalactonokinase